MSIKVGSDFSGVGAFNQALIRLGIEYEEVFACDMDKAARKTFIENYGEPKYFPKNVYKRKIPTEPIDIYMTSPPCQTFSIAGHRKGKEDEKGILFFNSYEFIKNNKPRYFIFENVKGLLSDDNGNTFSEWVNYLGGKSINGLPVIFPYEKSVPYHLYYKVINAKKMGIPQNRERIFLIGIRDDKDNVFTWPKNEYLVKQLKDVLENKVNKKYNLSQEKIEKLILIDNKNIKVKSATKKGYENANNGDSINFTVLTSKTRRGRVGKGVAHTLETISNQAVLQLNKSKECNGVQPYQQNRVYDINSVNPALNAGQEVWGGNIINTQQIRRLTPRECFRLMDFPESFTWTCSDSQAYKQAGNSIVVKCLEGIISKLNL